MHFDTPCQPHPSGSVFFRTFGVSQGRERYTLALYTNMKIKDRIKELRRVPANELMPHPSNWRKHPDNQADAMRGVLSEIGWADAVLAYETADGLRLCDGHLRAEVAGSDTPVPVLVLDITEEEARYLLATHDAVTDLAEVSPADLDELLATIDTNSEAVQTMLDHMQGDVFDADDVSMPLLPDGDRSGFKSMAFHLTDAQHEAVTAAIADAKQHANDDTGNPNANGNALALIAGEYLRQGGICLTPP